MKTFSLNGVWDLFPCPPDESEITAPDQLSGRNAITGHVPGNLELDYASAFGIEDPFTGLKPLDFQKLEFHDWWYVTEFITPDGLEECDLIFDGVDTFGELFLNGGKIGEFDNAFISHLFPVQLTPHATNKLAVRIRPLTSLTPAEDISRMTAAEHFTASTGAVRKPAHASGWDICPRLNLGGIWKGVRLERDDSLFRLEELYIQTLKETNEKEAKLKLHYRYSTKSRDLRGLKLRLKGVCGESVFEDEFPVASKNGFITVRVKNPVLWWPYGHGKPALYTLTGTLVNGKGEEVATLENLCGIRTLELRRTDMNEFGKGEFAFYVNGRKIRILGTNHVPADALHSRDAGRIGKILEMVRDLGCNMIRCWGGGVYEDEFFYDFCDKNGILVWQDFMLACTIPPHDEAFAECIRKEVTQVVTRLRKHPSIALWSGDNECDVMSTWYDIAPNTNTITRRVIPELLQMLDPLRPYLPSSPYIADSLWQKILDFGPQAFALAPEKHLWGTRETFKIAPYNNSGAKFISETGWHGAPNASSIRKFITEEHWKVDPMDPEWDLHAANAFGDRGPNHGRNRLMTRHQEEYYGKVMDGSLEEFARASQIFQAEALKFTVETVRLDPGCDGILWWNLIDCWPQFSDAIVDYYYAKKLAYYYIRRIQEPFCIMCKEPVLFHSNVMAVNDSPMVKSGTFEVVDGETKEQLLAGEFSLNPGEHLELGKLRSPRGINRLWLIRWTFDDGITGVNHYISGNLVMDYQWYDKILKAIAELDHSFDPDSVGK